MVNAERRALHDIQHNHFSVAPSIGRSLSVGRHRRALEDMCNVRKAANAPGPYRKVHDRVG